MNSNPANPANRRPDPNQLSGKVDYVGVEEEMEALELREKQPGQ